MTDSTIRDEALYSLNAVCPYFTMFPLDFPISVLQELEVGRKRRGIVVDPFCGRGTTNLAALRFCKRTIGVDSAPVAVAATAGKLCAPQVSIADIVAEAQAMLDATSTANVPDGEFWGLAFEPSVLRQICAIREGLKSRPSTPARDMLRAIMLGALHGPRRVDGSSRYFSNQMPRTYAPKPNYSVRFWRTRNMTPTKANVMQIIEERATRVLRCSTLRGSGSTYQADSRTFDWNAATTELGPIRWIVTSPPY